MGEWRTIFPLMGCRLLVQAVVVEVVQLAVVVVAGVVKWVRQVVVLLLLLSQIHKQP